MQNNQTTLEMIDKYIATQRIPHAFLFKAFHKVEMDKYVLYLINKINNWNLETLDEHTPFDLKVLDSSKNIVNKETLKKVINEMASSAVETNSAKILLIKNIENIHHNSVSSLLKYIEEPFKNSYIILTTNAINKVLPTVKSRCQIFNINKALFDNEFDLSKERFALFSKITNNAKTLKQEKDFLNLTLEDLNSLLKTALKNPYQLKIYLDATITKENAFLVLGILKELFILIVSVNFNKELFFDKETFLNYINSEIDLIKILEKINRFLEDLETPTNFNLLKESFLIDFLGAYGK